MKTLHNISTLNRTFGKINSGYHNTRAINVVLFSIILTGSLVFAGCEDNGTNNEEEERNEPVVVEVTASHDHETGQHKFVTDTEEVPTGWVTFRFINATEHVHFLFLDHLPDGKTEEDMAGEVYPVFQAATKLVKQGKFEEAGAEYTKLPPWSADIVYRGGPGFISGGHTVETTAFLPPGNYVMECYVLDENFEHHYTNGMYKGLTVTDNVSDALEPDDADIQMELTGSGFGMQGSLSPGTHKVKVTFVEAAPALFGYDVHLARLDQDTDISVVASWMDSATPTGLISDEGMPAPAEFLGGTQDMPLGNTAYFTIDLDPGRYAWIMEQPANASIYEEFAVSN